MKWRGLVAAAWASAVLALYLAGEIPCWKLGGSAFRQRLPLLPVGGLGSLRKGDLVWFDGDSNTAGSRIGGREHAFPQIFEKSFAGNIIVQNRATGGATVDSIKVPNLRIRLAVLMIGTNDAAPRGLLARRKALPTVEFGRRLKEKVLAFQEAGTKVLVLAAPPAGSEAMDARIRPFRVEARRVAIQTGASYRDPAVAMLGKQKSPILQYDALHFTRYGHELIAHWLRNQILIEN